jgi:hypothetical protein
MATIIYNTFKQKVLTGDIDLEADTIKCALVTASYTPNADTHTSWSHITNEISATGYTAGGKVVTLRSKVEWWYSMIEMNELIWPDSTIANMRGAVFYKAVTDPSQSWLICYFDTLTDKNSYNSDFYFFVTPLMLFN